MIQVRELWACEKHITAKDIGRFETGPKLCENFGGRGQNRRYPRPARNH